MSKLDIRKITRAVLALMLVGTVCGIPVLAIIGKVEIDAAIKIAAFLGTPAGTVIGFYFKPDKDEH